MGNHFKSMDPGKLKEAQQSLYSKVCYDVTNLFIYLFTLTYRMKWRHSALFEKLLSGASLQTVYKSIQLHKESEHSLNGD